ETSEADPEVDGMEELFSTEALWATAKEGKYEIEKADIMELTSDLPEETNCGRATAEIVESLQPENLMQVGFAAEAWKMLSETLPWGDPRHENDVVVLSSYEDGTAKAVIERDDSILTPAEKIEHREALRAALLKQLRQWAGFMAMSRTSWRGAKNLVDAKWVDEWKWTQASDGTATRIIRSRLTVRGFKDRHKDEVKMFTGTSARWGQRMVNILAAQHQWKLCSGDNSSAILQGMTFEEVVKLLNEPIRDICFESPKGSGELLCEAEGFEGINSILEVLHMEKGGFGLNDAPRLFGLSRDQVLLSIGLRATHADPQLWLKHESRVLVMVASTHLHDLKYAGRDKATSELVRALEAVFGKMTMQEKKFKHCGLRHRQLEDMSIEVNQTEYIKNQNCIDEKELQGMADDA
ncbi:unnamed protein product, partial [Prorocentrum cordatum]